MMTIFNVFSIIFGISTFTMLGSLGFLCIIDDEDKKARKICMTSLITFMVSFIIVTTLIITVIEPLS